MSKEKKLFITTIILGVMCPVCVFGLSFIADAFALVGIYCGFSALLCHNCFLKKHGNMDSCNENESHWSTDKAVESLRQKIISEISAHPADQYQLAALLWNDAASCFPNKSFQWDGAWFRLDLKTGKLSAEVSTYPNAVGACYEASFSLSAARFKQIAHQYNFRRELQAFYTEEDWAKLFDDNLKAAVSSACAILQKRDEDHKK